MDLSESEEEPWNFAALYLSEGAPIGFLWFAGVSVGSITALTSLLVLPWTLKFLWAPLVDVLRPRRGGRRTWVPSW